MLLAKSPRVVQSVNRARRAKIRTRQRFCERHAVLDTQRHLQHATAPTHCVM